MSLKLYKEIVRQSIEEFMIYRVRAIMTFVIGTIFFLVELIAGVVFFKNTDLIYGWSREDYFLVISVGSTITYLYQMFFAISHENLPEIIIEGELDFALVRPANSLLYYSLGRIDISSFFNALLSIGLQIYLLSGYSVDIGKIILMVIYEILGVILLFLLNQAIATITFWKDNAGALMGIPEYLTDFSTRPIDIYPKGIRFLISYILPVAFVINAPVLVIKERASMANLAQLLAVNIALFILVQTLWKKGLKRYISSS